MLYPNDILWVIVLANQNMVPGIIKTLMLRSQKTYMYNPWIRTKGREEKAGGLGGAGQKGEKGEKQIEKTVIA